MFYQLKHKEVVYGCMTVILDRKAFSQKTTKEDAILYFTVCTRQLTVPHPQCNMSRTEQQKHFMWFDGIVAKK